MDTDTNTNVDTNPVASTGANKNKIIAVSIVVVIAVLGIALGGYVYLRGKKSVQPTATDIQAAVDVAGSVAASATQGVLPSIGEAANPLTNKPDINPTSKTNPFDSVKTNPFQ